MGLPSNLPAHHVKLLEQDYNPDYVGGNIMTDAKDVTQVLFGPQTTLRPHDVGIPGHYLCSAAPPPGLSAHGMCGHRAAPLALRHLEQRAHGRVTHIFIAQPLAQ